METTIGLEIQIMLRNLDQCYYMKCKCNICDQKLEFDDVSVGWMYDDSTIFLDRKKKKYNEFMGIYEEKS